VRIVLDTTILVRANENSQGLARELLLKIVTGRHDLLLSNEMLHELARVLRYPRLQAFYGLSEERLYSYIGFLNEVAEIVTLNPMLMVPIRDVNDIIVVQTAVIGAADVLCTTDEDFYGPETASFLEKTGTIVMNDVDLIQDLRS